MTIETKFDVGQTVWIMFNNEPETWRVEKIHLGDVTHGSHTLITYDLVHQGRDHCGSIHEVKQVMEHKIHATKRDLLNSFLTEND